MHDRAFLPRTAPAPAWGDGKVKTTKADGFSMVQPQIVVSRIQWEVAKTFVAIGSLCVVAGGLVAAVTASVPSDKGTWAAAYLVLVAGVAQLALGGGQAWLATDPPSPRVVAAEVASFNIGNAGVLAGTLLGTQWLVDAGGVVLAVALLLFLRGGNRWRHGWQLRVYQALIVFVLVSIPVGLMLARIDGGCPSLGASRECRISRTPWSRVSPRRAPAMPCFMRTFQHVGKNG